MKLLIEDFHSEMMNANVKVIVGFPGAVNTNITKNAGLDNASTSIAEK